MLIDVVNVDSYPVELKEVVQHEVDCCTQEIEDIKNQLTCGTEPVIAFEKQYGCNTRYYWYQSTLIPIFCKYDIACYHITKALDPERFMQTGLYTNDIVRYCKRLREELHQCGFVTQEQDYIIDLAQQEYKRKHTSLRIHPLLFFTSGMDTLKMRYDQFTENIGGELVRWPLEEHNPEMQTRLRHYGKPCVVKFRLPFKEIEAHDHYGIVQQFVYDYLAKSVFNIDYHIAFDAKTSIDIPPEDILEVIPCEEVKYDE